MADAGVMARWLRSQLARALFWAVLVPPILTIPVLPIAIAVLAKAVRPDIPIIPTWSAFPGAVAAGLALGALAAEYVLYLSFAGVLAFGLPAHLVLRRLKVTGLVAYILVGAVGGALVEVVLVGSPLVSGFVPEPAAAYIVANGALSALAFWRILRPDRGIRPA